MNITIWKDRVSHKTNRYWNHFVFHPTDAIEDDWGKRILDQCADDGVGEFVRIYSMFEDIYTLDADGTLREDYELNDYRVRYLLSKGFDVMIAYAFIPPWLSENTAEQSSVAKNKTRYKGKMICTAVPKDVAVWGDLCYRYTKHMVETFGSEAMSKMMVHCYNEPDLRSFFMASAANARERAAVYVKMYAAFEAGIEKAEKEYNEAHPDSAFRMTIGGPALAGDRDFYTDFMDFIQEGPHRLDYFAFHIYGTKPPYLNNGSLPLKADNSAEKVLWFANDLKARGYGDLPLVADEWGACTAGFYNREECPTLLFRENEIYSCYFVKMIAAYDRLNLPLSKLMICLSGQHEMTTDFSGFRNFFTLNFFPKPIYHAFRLSRRLGEMVLCYDRDDSEKDSPLTVFPTKTREGRVVLFVAYGNPHFTTVPDETPLPELPVSLSFPGVAEKEARVTLIDRDHATGYTEYLRLGGNDNPCPAEIEQMRKASELRTETIPLQGGKLDVTMLNNGVAMVEL